MSSLVKQLFLLKVGLKREGTEGPRRKLGIPTTVWWNKDTLSGGRRATSSLKSGPGSGLPASAGCVPHQPQENKPRKSRSHRPLPIGCVTGASPAQSSQSPQGGAGLPPASLEPWNNRLAPPPALSASYDSIGGQGPGIAVLIGGLLPRGCPCRNLTPPPRPHTS